MTPRRSTPGTAPSGEARFASAWSMVQDQPRHMVIGAPEYGAGTAFRPVAYAGPNSVWT